ncbi:hypothetical protein EXE41_02570 [Halorubrum sp. SD690R]|uniref:hypothetical protein n=1 Tax=Halorubrum sp. SD690R TaxID=2518117 RepID=UPI0010F5FB3A|nr:hypothetical protein [Halorubrum sp. SD690R]TKX47820.1 hypothetical protein EXE41_02570 [Halorubrum sp. SD690R]
MRIVAMSAENGSEGIADSIAHVPSGVEIVDGGSTTLESYVDEECWLAYVVTDDSKVPCDPNSARPKYVNGHEATGATTYQDALHTVHESQHRLGESRRLNGVGLALSQTDLIAIDLDDVVTDDGCIAPDASELVSDLGTYTELSPSGTGLHLLLADERGVNDSLDQKAPLDGQGEIELYDSRMMTFTGGALESFSDDVVECTGLTTALQREYVGTEVEQNNSETDSAIETVDYTPRENRLSDKQQRLVNAMLAHDDDATELWERGSTAWDSASWSHDRSRADASLASKLAWWAWKSSKFSDTKFTETELIEIFLESDLAQRKKCQNRDDYVPRTIRSVR